MPHFEDIDIEKNLITDTLYYALMIGQQDTFPKMVFLGNHHVIDSIVNQPMESVYSTLYLHIWKDIEPVLINKKELYIAPSGLFCNISFNAIKINDNYLGDKYIIHNLLSTKDIISLKYENENYNQFNSKKIALFGGADYMTNLKTVINNDDDEIIEPMLNLNRAMLEYMDNLRGPGFSYLPGSKTEVQEINRYLKDINWETSLFIDKDATETCFKSLASRQSPEVIHISTHGFYFPQPELNLYNGNSALPIEIKPSVYRLSDNPLMRSGLIFAGANHVWKGNEPVNGVDDGILTAYEIANLNLFNTELVVLSACNTGLGDIDKNEGVYGLQRAFRMAGVRTMIVSLWEIPDKETVELMTEFYTIWGDGIAKKEAFDRAQMKMRYNYPNQPEKWAGFIMIE